MILNARTLMRIALALDLNWQPDSITDQVIIRSSATMIDVERIRTALSNQLRTEGLDGRFNVSFNGLTPRLVLPGDQPEEFEISELHFNLQDDRFEARIVAPAMDNVITEAVVYGKIQRLVEVPVLKDTVARGEIINSYDIIWIDAVRTDLQGDVMLAAEDIIGMSPRRMVVAGKPIREGDLEQPLAVSRGDTVTIVYETGPMVLTAEGRALENGARGDVIRVVNTGSNRTVDVLVKDANYVAVRAN